MFRVNARKLSSLGRVGIRASRLSRGEQNTVAVSKNKTGRAKFSIHPLFLLLGVWYSFTGELFLFLLSALVALQHECAHAFAAAKLGYKLNKIVLMPFGAVIDGDLKGISVKDELSVALAGPFCNLLTAGFFAALWWFAPTMYAFTDTAYYSSLAIALVNLLPAYPLDGGRVLKCVLENALSKTPRFALTAERTAERTCRAVTLLFALGFLALFILSTMQNGTWELSALLFSIFLFFGGFGNREKTAYDKIDLSCKDALARGVELKRVAVLSSCQIKNTFRYLSRGTLLVLEVYGERENKLFELTQNELSELFEHADTPYATLSALYEEHKKRQKTPKKE